MLDAMVGSGIGLLVLLMLSGFFSMSETAVIRANRFHIRDQAQAGIARAKHLDRMLSEPEKILSSILVGNNLVNIAAASLSTFIAVQIFGPTGAFYATIVVTVGVLIFAEITPKTLAVRHPTSLALFLVYPLLIFEYALRPFAVVLTAIAGVLLRFFGVKETRMAVVTTDDIEAMVRVGTEEGEVEKFEQQVIEEVFEFTETPVRDVMTLGQNVVSVDKEARLIDGLEIVGESGHSRILVTDGGFANVLGFIHAKDLLRFSDADLRRLPVTHNLRGVLYVGSETDCHRVLARMQKNHKLLAVVQDGEGQNVGIATVEDLLEEIVGEIRDEFDEEELMEDVEERVDEFEEREEEMDSKSAPRSD